MANYSDIKARGKKSFANSASFPASGNTGEIIVDQATGTLHVWKGSRWDRVASGPDAGMNFTTEAQSSYDLASDGTATTVTVAASDPEGFPVTYSYDVLPANQSQATIVNNNDGTFTITPSTNSANAGNFTLRIKADDGRKVVRTTSTVYLAFATLTVSPAVSGNTTFTSGSVTGFTANTVYTLSNNTGANFDLDFDLEGGAGGGRSSDGTGGGAGGLTSGRYTLAANSSINLLVGAKGNNGTDSRYGGNGGEGTGIYTGTYGSGEVPIMVAGGGGGSMNGGTQTGGGGGTTGGAGSDTSTNSNDTPAGGGTQSAAGGGAGGNRFNGVAGSGRNGGAAALGASFGGYTNPNTANSGPGFGNGGVGCFYPSGGGAGGGGGGYYGGGGGAIVYLDGGSGGAGGSGYFDSNVVTNGSTTTSGGTANSNGSCTITFV
jgi:hypothetical protein